MSSAQSEQDERWYVQLDSEEVRLMTIEQLDEAFQRGTLHENTYVIQVGATQWQTLGEVARLSEDAEEPPAPEPVVAAIVAASPYLQAPQAPKTQPMAPASAWPPAAQTRAPGPAPVAMASSMPPAYASPRSVIPVVQDLPSYDFDTADFRPRKTKLFVALAGAVAALGAAGFAVAQLDASPTSKVEAPPAAPVAAAFNPGQAERFDDSAAKTPTPEVTSTANNETESAKNSRLSEDMKKALLVKDTERAAKKSRARPAPKRSSGKKSASGPFKAGGSVHDPLNEKL